MMRGIIIGDSLYEEPRTSIARTTGAHRIATLLRKEGIVVDVLDFFNSWTPEELNKILNAHPINFLGLSLGLGKLNTEKTNYFICKAREFNPDIKVIVGGGQALTDTFDGIDLYFRGFADGAISDIVEYLKTGYYNTQALAKVSVHETRTVVDCNKHYMTFDLSNLKTEYIDTDFLHHDENLGLETSRGCIFKCKFCNFALIGKKKNDYIRSKEDIKSELIENHARWGIKKYSITDDTFNDNEIKVDMLYEISQEVDFELSFMCYARADLLHARPGSLDKMVKAGVKGMHFGIETLSLESSKLIGKGFSGEPLKNYLREIKKTYPDLHLTGSFIIGLPKETIEESERNIHQMLDENLLDATPIFQLAIPKNSGAFSDLSEFSLTWDKHGYEELSEEELKDLLTLPKYKLFKDMNIERVRKEEILWKNSYMNILDAALAAGRIKKKADTLSGWHRFALGISANSSLDKLLKLKKKEEWDWNSIKQSTINFIEDYKNKKILTISHGQLK